MSWVKIDDAMPDHLKVVPLSDAAFRAYVTSICYAARSLSDGFIPFKKAKEFAGRARVIQELVPGLWETAEGGFRVHDYLQYNPSREAVTKLREHIKQERSKAGSKGVANRWQNTKQKAWQNDSPVPVPDPVPLNRNDGSHYS